MRNNNKLKEPISDQQSSSIMDLIGRYGINSFPVFYINPFSYRHHSSPGCWQQQTDTNSRTHSIVSRANTNNKQLPLGGYYNHRRYLHRCGSRRGIRRGQRRDIVNVGRGRRGDRSLTTIIPVNDLADQQHFITSSGEDSIVPNCGKHVPAISISSSPSLSDSEKAIYEDQGIPIIRISPPHSPLNKRTTVVQEGNNLNNNNNNKTEQIFNKNDTKQSTLDISENTKSCSVETPPGNVLECGLLLSSLLTNETNSVPPTSITEILSEFTDDHTGEHIKCGRKNGSLNYGDNTSCFNHHQQQQQQQQQQNFNQYSVSPTTATQRRHVLSLIKEEQSLGEDEEENEYNIILEQPQESNHIITKNNSSPNKNNYSTVVNNQTLTTSTKQSQVGNNLINSSFCCEQKSELIKNDALEFWFDDNTSTSKNFDDRNIKDTGATDRQNCDNKYCFDSMYFQLTSNQIPTAKDNANFVRLDKNIDGTIKPVHSNESELLLIHKRNYNNKGVEITCTRDKSHNENNIIKERNNIVNERYLVQQQQAVTMDIEKAGNGNLATSYSVISECSSEVENDEEENLGNQVGSSIDEEDHINEEEIVKHSLDFSDSCDADDESSVSFSNIRPTALPLHHHRLGNKHHSFDGVVESKTHHHNHHYHHHRHRKISRLPSMDCPVLLEDRVLPTSNDTINSGISLISEDHFPINSGLGGAVPVPEDGTLDELSRSCSCPQDVNTIYKRLSDVGLNDLPRVKHSLEGASMFRRQGSDRRSRRRAADNHRQRKKGISTMEMSTLDLLTVFEAASRNTPSRLSLRLKDTDKDVSLFNTNYC